MEEAQSSVPVSSRPPALADDEVPCAGERDGVAVVGGREVNVAAGAVVLVVVLAASEVLGSDFEVRKIWTVWLSSWGSERP